MRVLALVTMVVALAACGRPFDASEPPPVLLTAGEESHELMAWSYCWSGVLSSVCADGAPPDDPVDVGSPEAVVVDFPNDGWSFNADFVETGTECGRHRSATVRPDAAGGGSRATIDPVGPAGTYDVQLSGRGPKGDMAASFRWTTPTDAPAARPTAEVRVLSDRDGGAVVVGMELVVTDVATVDGPARATVAVLAADGTEVTFEATSNDEPCSPGHRYWFADADRASGVVPPGGARFTYVVDVELGDGRHMARATWPDPAADDGFVPLDFEPPLPEEPLD